MPANDGAAMQWSANGAQAAVLLRPGANKDRWIATVDLAAAKPKPVHRLIDVAWVNNGNNDFGWLPRRAAAGVGVFAVPHRPIPVIIHR